MNLSQHVTLEEFTASDTAARLGIDNTLPAVLMPVATDTAKMIERIRAFLCDQAGRDIPIIITSGFRCPDLNTAIGSALGSDHPRGMAVDFKAPAFGTPLQVAQALAGQVSILDIGQLIHEYGTWVHVSTRRPDKALNRIITIDRAGTHVGIQAAA